MEKLTFKQRMEGFGKFVWNGEEGKVLGRGARSWGEIGIFYLIYYICLAGFFIATIAVFYETIDEFTPALTGSSSLLKGNPGIGFRPQPDSEKISINSRPEEKAYKKYLENMKDFLKPYKNTKAQYEDCSGIDEPRRDADTPCAFDVENITAACSESNAFGMTESAPCVVLKINKVFGWVPDLWTESEIAKTGVPDDIKNQYKPDRVWVHCKGRKSGDNKKLEGATIEYFPMQGFPVAFFPFKTMENYLTPLVFVKFSNVQMGTTIKVECRAYAKNIDYDRTEKLGGAQFELNVK